MNKPEFSVKELSPCLFAIMVDVLGFGVVAPLLVTLFSDFSQDYFHIGSTQWRYFFLGLTLALYGVLMFFGTSFIGDLSDRIGRKRTLLISMLGMSAGQLMMGLGVSVASLMLFILGRAIAGITSASQSVALATISDLSTPNNKAIHLSYVALIQCIGFILGPLMGGLLANWSLTMPFYGAAALAALSAAWIAGAFQETCIKGPISRIRLFRIVEVFIQAYQHERIRKLGGAFLLMQIAVGIFLPLLLVYLNEQFAYTAFDLGIFNGYLGIGFAAGLLLLLPLMLKRMRIEKIVGICLVGAFLFQAASAILSMPVMIWILLLPYAVLIEAAYSGMYTSFSNAAEADAQGWAMGISVALMALAWGITGFTALLIPIVGFTAPFIIGALCMGVSALLMMRYLRLHPA